MKLKIFKTFNNGSLGSRIDEERSEIASLLFGCDFAGLDDFVQSS